MTETSETFNSTQRRTWLGVLARASAAQLQQAVTDAGPLPDVHMVRQAEYGMVMLRGRVGGTGDAFNVGEASVTRCALRLGNGSLGDHPQADGPLGVGYVLGRDRLKATLLATLDALLQEPHRQTQLLQTVVQPLSEQQAAARQAASVQTASSRVDFFTLVRGET